MSDLKNKANINTCESICSVCEQRHINPICSSDDLLSQISSIKIDLHFDANTTLFQMGDVPKGLYSVKSGLVKIENYSRSGSAHTLRLFGPGSVFGYRSIFNDESSQASAVAVQDTEVCLLPREPILAVAKKNPEVLFKLVQQLSSDLKAAEQKWVRQMDLSAHERVADALLFLTDKFKNVTWTRKDIAQWAGTTPETVIRTLSQFESEGLIDQSQGRSIHVKNRSGLEKYCLD